MRWQYLFFDLDGTLTDPMLGITRSVQYALRHFGIEVTDLSTLCPFIGPPLKDSFREFYGMNDTRAEEAIALTREYFAPKGIFENELYAGIPQLLEALRQGGARIAMATSKPAPFARRIAEHFAIDRYFDLIEGSTLDGTRTTKSEVLRLAIEGLGVTDPAQAVMVGDRRFDIEGAAATGIESIGVLYGYGSREELEQAGATHIVADVGELGRLLLGSRE